MSEQPLRGSFWIFVLYDVAEQIQLEDLRRILSAEPARRGPSFKHPSPDYVRFERPPVTEYSEMDLPNSPELMRGHVKYFDYGEVSVELESNVEARWRERGRVPSERIATRR